MLRIAHHANGPRVYVLGMRVHHGTTGVVCACVLRFTGQKHRRVRTFLMCVCACAVWHDRKDFPWTDSCNH